MAKSFGSEHVFLMTGTFENGVVFGVQVGVARDPNRMDPGVTDTLISVKGNFLFWYVILDIVL